MRDANRESSGTRADSAPDVDETWRPGNGRKVDAERHDRFDEEQQYQQTPRPAPMAADRHEWGP